MIFTATEAIYLTYGSVSSDSRISFKIDTESFAAEADEEDTSARLKSDPELEILPLWGLDATEGEDALVPEKEKRCDNRDGFGPALISDVSYAVRKKFK